MGMTSELHHADSGALAGVVSTEYPGLSPGDTNRLTKSRAVWATSRQPWSIVREWPRLGIFTISVTPGLRRCRLQAAFAIAHGTVWSFAPSMISRGPRAGFLVSTFASVQGLM